MTGRSALSRRIYHQLLVLTLKSVNYVRHTATYWRGVWMITVYHLAKANRHIKLHYRIRWVETDYISVTWSCLEGLLSWFPSAVLSEWPLLTIPVTRVHPCLIYRPRATVREWLLSLRKHHGTYMEHRRMQRQNKGRKRQRNRTQKGQKRIFIERNESRELRKDSERRH